MMYGTPQLSTTVCPSDAGQAAEDAGLPVAAGWLEVAGDGADEVVDDELAGLE